jgi:hypothetical protein
VLTLRRQRCVALACALLLGASLAVAQPARADYTECQTVPGSNLVVCRVIHTPPPDHGTSGSRTGDRCRTRTGQAVPCYAPGNGYWDAAYQCYAHAVDPQPALTDPVWRGHTTGTIFACTGGQGAGSFWSPQAAPGPPPAVQLAQRAASLLRIPELTAVSNGGPSQTTYVGIPSWLWVTGWKALTSPPAAVAGRSVRATAVPTSVTWSMGDGKSVTCRGPGAPFDPRTPSNPRCGYTYRIDSSAQPQTGPSPNDRYFTVRGSVTWAITWTCTGSCDQRGGTLPAILQQTTPMPLRVFQVETVVTGSH